MAHSTCMSRSRQAQSACGRARNPIGCRVDAGPGLPPTDGEGLRGAFHAARGCAGAQVHLPAGGQR